MAAKGKAARTGAAALAVGILTLAVALGVSERLRKKVLDALFGAEDRFNLTPPATPTTTPGASTVDAPEHPAIPVASDLGEDLGGHVDDPPRPERDSSGSAK